MAGVLSQAVRFGLIPQIAARQTSSPPVPVAVLLELWIIFVIGGMQILVAGGTVFASLILSVFLIASLAAPAAIATVLCFVVALIAVSVGRVVQLLHVKNIS